MYVDRHVVTTLCTACFAVRDFGFVVPLETIVDHNWGLFAFGFISDGGSHRK